MTHSQQERLASDDDKSPPLPLADGGNVRVFCVMMQRETDLSSKNNAHTRDGSS